MRVEAIMSRDVVTVLPSATIKEVARLLARRRISGVPVVADDGRLVGVVSEGDIVFKERGVGEGDGRAYQWLFGRDDEAALKREAATAAEAMTTPAVTIEPQRTIDEAAQLMVRRSVNRLPVVSEKRLVGILTRADLVRAFVRTDEELAREIREEVLLHMLWIDPCGLRVHVGEGQVVLAGELATRTQVDLVCAYTARVPGVVAVDASGLTWRTDDLARRGWPRASQPVS
jgi:CBS domain-containing protein